MILVIANVLDTHEVAALRAAADKLDFVDGRTTAGRYARDVKQNLQAKPSKTLDGLFEKVRTALTAHEVFQAGARPRKFARMLLSRYRTGPRGPKLHI